MPGAHSPVRVVRFDDAMLLIPQHKGLPPSADKAETLPTFIIVGAAKSGSTTLVSYLQDHSDVFIPRSELHFFDDDENYRRGVDWYGRHFVGAADRRVVGEKTPSYSYIERVPERIH